MLKTYPTKPCRFCGGLGHWPYQCFQNPKRKALKTSGKTNKQWLVTRRTYFKRNPPIMMPFPHYECYICGKWLIPPKSSGYYSPEIAEQLGEYPTLDHVLSRSRHPELRFGQDNLKPCCWQCNTEKGSKDGNV